MESPPKLRKRATLRRSPRPVGVFGRGEVFQDEGVTHVALGVVEFPSSLLGVLTNDSIWKKHSNHINECVWCARTHARTHTHTHTHTSHTHMRGERERERGGGGGRAFRLQKLTSYIHCLSKGHFKGGNCGCVEHIGGERGGGCSRYDGRRYSVRGCTVSSNRTR